MARSMCISSSSIFTLSNAACATNVQQQQHQFQSLSSVSPVFRQGFSSGRRISRILTITAVGWDPEGILAEPRGGHIERRKWQKMLQGDEEQRQKVEAAAKAELERRRQERDARVVPASDVGLIDFFLSTDVPEMEYEIARCRARLTPAFFAVLSSEKTNAKFSLLPSSSDSDSDRLIELEALEKVLLDGIAAYDRMAEEMVNAKEKLARILESREKKQTLLDMAAKNELDKSLLLLLDQNIAAAHSANQVQAVEFMEKIRGAVLKYMTK